MTDLVKIKDVAERFKLDERDVYQELLYCGNKNAIKLMHKCEGFTVVSAALNDEIVRVASNMENTIVPVGSLVPTNMIPIDSGRYVYFLFDERYLLYVGQSVDVCSRMSAHKKDKAFNGVAFIEVAANASLNAVESMNIMYHSPPLNKTCWIRKEYLRAVLQEANIDIF
jgi:hypothetical protein